MKLYISHGADPGDDSEPCWFVVLPLEGQTVKSVIGTDITCQMAVGSLLAAGRVVFELSTDTGLSRQMYPANA